MMLCVPIGEDHVAPAVICPSALTRVEVGAGCTLPDVTGLVTVSDNSAGPIAVFQSPASWSAIVQSPTVVTVVAVDQSGNSSGPCSFSIALFSAPPTITCPGAVTGTVGTDRLVAVPDFVSGAVSSGGCGVTVTQDPAAGTKVGVGTYSVTLTAGDPFGQSATCGTSFSAVAPPAPTIV